MRIAIYARVSTSDGRQDTANQLSPLREWSKRLGGSIAGEYVDEASGSKGDRVALNRLLEDAHHRKFDTLLIWALDRLSREGIARMTGYLERLKSCGVRVISHQEPWLDTSGPVSELLQAVFAWLAKQERERIRERVRAGLERARSQGKRLGRPTISYDPEQIIGLKQAGLSFRAIAKETGVSTATISRLLQNLSNLHSAST